MTVSCFLLTFPHPVGILFLTIKGALQRRHARLIYFERHNIPAAPGCRCVCALKGSRPQAFSILPDVLCAEMGGRYAANSKRDYSIQKGQPAAGRRPFLHPAQGRTGGSHRRGGQRQIHPAQMDLRPRPGGKLRPGPGPAGGGRQDGVSPPGAAPRGEGPARLRLYGGGLWVLRPVPPGDRRGGRTAGPVPRPLRGGPAHGHPVRRGAGEGPDSRAAVAGCC